MTTKHEPCPDPLCMDCRCAALEAENTRLKDYITRRAHDEHVQCCISRELVATWERDAAVEHADGQ